MVQQLPLEQKVGTGNTGTGTSTGKNNGNTGAATGNTGSTTLTIDQIPSHRHSFRTVKDNATNSGGELPKGNNSQGDNQGWATAVGVNDSNNALGYTGGGKGHTHTLNSHTHTLNNHQHTIPYIECYVWKRTA